jgi:hypothetical protein
MRHLLLIGFASAALLPASGINGPVSGFVLDGGARAIRPVNGMPGSATQGAPLPLPFSVGLAAISPRLDFALVTDAAGDGTPSLAAGLRSGEPQIAAIDGAIPADGIVLSDSGDTAALYSNRSGRLQFITGLPSQPRAGDAIDVGSLTGGVAALTLDTQGRNGVVLAGDGGVYWLSGRAALNWIVQVPGAGSAAFLANGSDVVVGSKTTGDVLLLHDAGGNLSISTLAGARDGISSAVAVHAMNGSEVGVVERSGRLAAIDVNTSTVAWVDLAGAADRLEMLAGGLLVLNPAGPQPLLVLDISQGRTAYFVPPVPSDSQVQLQRLHERAVARTGKHI